MASDLLDMPLYMGQRSATFDFQLLDGRTGIRKGTLTPLRDQSPTLSHDTTSTISRRVSGLVLGVDDARLINSVTDRIEITMVLGDRVRTRYPLGRYMVADDVDAVTSGGELTPLTLLDEMFIIDQELEAGFDAGGELASTAMRRLLDGLPIAEPLIDPTGQIAVNAWSAGSSRATALKDLATVGGYFKPWFDHTSRLRVMTAFEPADRPPDFDFDDPPRVLRDSIARSNDLLTAPNRFVIISNNDATQEGAVPVVGVYDVPSSAPHSIAQRGFVQPQVLDRQVASQAQAQVYARTLGIQATIYERVSLATPADPRHDGYQVIRWDGQLWLEIGWSMPLRPGGTMTHTLRRTYPTTSEDETL